ncbi:MAG: DNA methyltransferase [Rikenellaceae bacterium]
MATISYKTAEERLRELAHDTSATELIYDLLRIFGGVSEASIDRIKEGKSNANLSKDGTTVLTKFGTPKRTVAYRPATAETLHEELQHLKDDPKVTKHAARLLIVSDGTKILAYDPKEDEEYDNDVALLHKDYDFFMPLMGVERFRNDEENDADVKASYIMARIYDDIRRYNELESDEQIHALNIFLTRLLFCFFAEDTGIFPKDLFTQSINDYTLNDGSDLGEYIEAAFDIMNIESPIVREQMPTKISQFPYVNGGLFAQHFAIPHLSARTRRLILKCGGFNWAEINPDIFGSMIQAVIRPEDRAGLGLHYTSVPNIMKVIRPLFLDELHEAVNAAKNSEKELNKLLIRLSKMKFFDPACGSGNFLIITYKELRKLENIIWKLIIELNHGQMIAPFSNIKLTQFYGIELDEFAQETAILSLWLAEHQMNTHFSKEFHISVPALPLHASGHIVHGNACRLDWSVVCPHSAEEEVYIMGNPPYLGSSVQSDEQKSDLDFVFNGGFGYKNLDYISAWFYLAAKYSLNSNVKSAFVTTNSICQGKQVSYLWEPLREMGIQIFVAYSSFKWNNNAKYNAGVTVVIIGICHEIIIKKRKLYINDTYKVVSNINAYLTDYRDVYIKSISQPISKFPEMLFGSKATDGGSLLMNSSERDAFVNIYPNCSHLVKRFIGSDEFINGANRFCFWIEDKQKDIAFNNPELNRRLNMCQDMRANSKKIPTQKLAATPWAFGERRYSESDSIIVPRVSSERRVYIPMGFMDAGTVISDSAFAIYDAQVWLFGILTSKMHMAWVKAVGGKLEERIRYSATICYNTFPFPKIKNDQREELERYAEEVLLTREDFPELTLAQLYDPEKMPQSLRDAHRALDLAVERCYRPEPFTSDEERLEHLFRLYEKMTKK